MRFLTICETPVSNKLALELAEKYDLPGISGSDSHVVDYIGSAYTEFSEFDITCNNDLIAAIKGGHITAAIGVEREETKKAKFKVALDFPAGLQGIQSRPR